MYNAAGDFPPYSIRNRERETRVRAEMDAAGLEAAMLPAGELERLEQAVRRMLATGRREGVEIIGAGEITCVMAWGGFACKRLPPFDTGERLDAYARLLDRYLRELRAAGIAVVHTAAQRVSAGGEHVGYVVQRRVPAHSLIPTVLRPLPAPEAAAFLHPILDHVDACVAASIGIDAQLSNWSLEDGRPLLLDVATPMVRDEHGRDLLDTEIFVSMLPVVLRGIVRRFLVGDVLDKNFNKRRILLDLVGNLPNYRLGHLTEPFLALINARLDTPLTLRDVLRYRRGEWWTWRLIRRALEAEQFWRRRILRQPDLNLLPFQLAD